MQTRLTVEQIAAIVTDTYVNAECFDWAAAVLEYHTDHMANCEAGIWAAVCNVIGDTSDSDFLVSPALVHFETSSDETGDYAPNSLVSCGVALLIGGTDQFVMLDNCVSIDTHNAANRFAKGASR